MENYFKELTDALTGHSQQLLAALEKLEDLAQRVETMAAQVDQIATKLDQVVANQPKELSDVERLSWIRRAARSLTRKAAL